MRLTDAERAENREALARMTLRQRLDYIWEYYKFPMVLMLIAVVALGSMLYYRITSREKLLYLACANIVVGDTLDSALNEGFTRAIGADPGRSEVAIYHNLHPPRITSIPMLPGSRCWSRWPAGRWMSC